MQLGGTQRCLQHLDVLDAAPAAAPARLCPADVAGRFAQVEGQRDRSAMPRRCRCRVPHEVAVVDRCLRIVVDSFVVPMVEDGCAVVGNSCLRDLDGDVTGAREHHQRPPPCGDPPRLVVPSSSTTARSVTSQVAVSMCRVVMNHRRTVTTGSRFPRSGGLAGRARLPAGRGFAGHDPVG
jgi:hypothetical protein